MSAFGQTLFGGSVFIRWALSPFVVLFAILLPVFAQKSKWEQVLVIGALEFLCVALLAGFWLPARFGRLAFRCVAGAVFAAYSAYVVSTFAFPHTHFDLLEDSGKTSPRNALLGFVVIGLPGLWYALFGRFTWRSPRPET
jgi:hypothetical protein